MSKLETLYNSIQGLKELGLPLNEETLKAVDNLEEELIKNEVIPRLAGSIEPIITQIKRPIVLVVDYVPGEALSVRLTRKRVIIDENESKHYSLAPHLNNVHDKKSEKAITSSIKSPWTGLLVTFPDGRVINNKYAYETMIEVIIKVGVQKVASLKIKHYGFDFISKTAADIYQQHKLPDGYLIITHSSTDKKKRQLEEISQKLGLGLKVEVV